MAALMQFLKKHYEKIILCVVLLGLAAAAIWMGELISQVKKEVEIPVAEAPHNSKPLVPLDLTTDMLALAQVTNPPPVVLSGEHNLFNPVTWKRKANGELLKILYTGPDALAITNISPLYTVVAYERCSAPGIYVFTVQTNSGRKMTEHPKTGEKTKSGLYIVHGIKGAPDDPESLQLEILDTQESVWISKGNPYKRVDGYVADMKYDPESRNLLKQHVNDNITLDNEQYKIVEITNNVVRVQSIKNTKVTTIRWSGAAETGAPATMTP
jgi:hypothetical protein